MKKFSIALMTIAVLATTGATSVRAQNDNKDNIRKKVEQYAVVPLKADLNELSRSEKELLSIFIEISKVMDELFWEQTLGN